MSLDFWQRHEIDSMVKIFYSNDVGTFKGLLQKQNKTPQLPHSHIQKLAQNESIISLNIRFKTILNFRKKIKQQT